jgi:DNA-directed RNA polymerase subunit B
LNKAFLTLLDTFAREGRLVRFQIDSYNDFITRRISKVLQEIGEIRPEVPELGELRIKLGKLRIGRPCVREADGSVRDILPSEARMRNLTYLAPMEVEMTTILNEIESEPKWIHFGDIPVMVKSKICPLSRMSRQELVEQGEDPDDPGGYFIINGTERVLVLIEEIAPNRTIATRLGSGGIEEIVRIHSEREGYVQRHLLERAADGTITISFANVHRLNVAILLKALGLVSDRDIILAISPEERIHREFFANLYEIDVPTQARAIHEIGRYIKVWEEKDRETRVTRLIDRYLLPHLGQDPANRLDKAAFLVRAIEKVIRLHLGDVEEDDLDHYSNKRLRLAGDLLEIQLRSILLGRWGLITRISYNYQKLAKRGRVPPLEAIVEGDVLTRQLISALAIGSWVGGRTGVSQRLERGSYIKTVSHIRNVLSPLTSAQEHFKARELHPTQWGRLCPAETPEGATIGLRKYLSIMAQITRGCTKREVGAVLDMVTKG